jgi:adenylyltransferase/sulfurtransferase
VQEINPLIDVVLHEERLDSTNVMEIFSQYDLIVDGTDNFATRYMVNDAAFFLGKPYVWGSIYRFDGQASVFWPTAPGGEAPCYRCLYPSRRRPAWSRAAPRAVCSASCAPRSARSRRPRRSSC